MDHGGSSGWMARLTPDVAARAGRARGSRRSAPGAGSRSAIRVEQRGEGVRVVGGGPAGQIGGATREVDRRKRRVIIGECGGAVVEGEREIGARPVEDGHEVVAEDRNAERAPYGARSRSNCRSAGPALGCPSLMSSCTGMLSTTARRMSAAGSICSAEARELGSGGHASPTGTSYSALTMPRTPGICRTCASGIGSLGPNHRNVITGRARLAPRRGTGPRARRWPRSRAERARHAR